MKRASTSADAGTYGIFARTAWGLLLLYVILFFARPQDIYGFAFGGLLKLIALPLIGCWILALTVERTRPVLDFAQARLLVVFCGLMCLSVPFAYITADAVGQLKHMVQAVFLLLIIASTVARTRDHYQALIRCFAFATAWLALEGVRRYALPGGGRWQGDVSGYFVGNVNDYALFMCATGPLLVYCAFTAKRRFVSYFWWVSAAAALASVAFSYSRGGMISLGCMGAYAVTRGSGRRGRALFVVLLVVLVLLFILPESYGSIFKGIRPSLGSQGGVEFEDNSAQARFDAWHGAIRMARDHPFVGVGVAGFRSAMWRGYRPPGTHQDWAAHSMYFQLLGELGLPGLVWVLALGWLNIRTTRAMRQSAVAAGNRDAAILAEAQEIGFVGFMVAAAFLSVAYYPTIYWLSWFIGMHYRLGVAPVADGEQPKALRRPTPRFVRV